jgi:hypothetical protein
MTLEELKRRNERLKNAEQAFAEERLKKEEAQRVIEGELRSVLHPLYELLDGCDPLWIPCELASKKPSISYSELTHDKLDWFYWQKLLDVGIGQANLAVKLGPVSGDLCTVDLDSDDLIEPFLALNPRLSETLRTRGSKGCQFWFKVEGPYPERVAPLVDGNGAPVGEWRGGGNGLSTIFGVHPSSARHIKTMVPSHLWRWYERVVEKPIVVIRYEEIKIPEDWKPKQRQPGERFKWSSNSEEE